MKNIKELEEYNDKLLNELNIKNELHDAFCAGVMKKLSGESELSLEEEKENLLRRLETYFLINGLTRKEVCEAYGRENFEEFKDIVSGISSDKLETSERIFEFVVNVLTKNKISQRISVMKEYGLEYNDKNTLEKIEEKLREFTFSEEYEEHSLYSEIAEKNQKLFNKLEEHIKFKEQIESNVEQA